MKFLADENLNNNIVRGLFATHPSIDLVRVQDVGLMATPDEDILEWAASEERILVTHDVATVTAAAFDRIGAGLPMPGVIAIRARAPLGRLLGDFDILLGACTGGDLDSRIEYLPFPS